MNHPSVLGPVRQLRGVPSSPALRARSVLRATWPATCPTPERLGPTKAVLFATILLICVPVSVPAVGQQKPAAVAPQGEKSAAAQANALILRALDLRREGNDAAALVKLLRALELDPTPRAKAQVAMAQQALATPQDPWIASRATVLRNSLQAIRERLGLLQIAGVPDGATIYIAGSKVGEAPLKKSLRVVAGEVAIRVEAPGHRTYLGTVAVEPGLLNRHVVTMIPLKPAASEPKPPKSG